MIVKHLLLLNFLKKFKIIAVDKALTEFEKYRIKQDKLYKSDFDLLIEETKE